MSRSLTNEERLLARLLFIRHALKANGNAYQQLFWAVMREKYGQEFIEVRPQGRKGDGGNDGYNPTTGHYYQVYAPIEMSSKISVACAKITADFIKLRKSWNHSTVMKAYSFVVNDKYDGVFPDLVKALASIESQYPGVTCRPFSTGHLEQEFLQLSGDGIEGVLGMNIPDASRITRIDYSILREAISFIMKSPADAARTRFGELPELSAKIALNGLCSAWADVVRNGARNAGHVELYFSKNSTFAKQSLRDHLVHAYKSASETVSNEPPLPPSLSRQDLVFAEFRSRLHAADAARAICDAVDVLIGYYFEACDIFDPYADKE